jgi:hypothetical protein
MHCVMRSVRIASRHAYTRTMEPKNECCNIQASKRMRLFLPEIAPIMYFEPI